MDEALPSARFGNLSHEYQPWGHNAYMIAHSKVLKLLRVQRYMKCEAQLHTAKAASKQQKRITAVTVAMFDLSVEDTVDNFS